MSAVRIFRRSILGAALAAGLAAAVAQPFDTPPPPAPARPLAIAAPKEHRLDNGLRVIVAERPGVPLVSVRLVVDSGAEQDPAGRAGLASLAAGLLTRGTRHHTAPQLASAAEALGGSLDSGAGWDHASVGITVTRPMLERATDLVAEVAREPSFAFGEIARLREQVLDELKVAYAQPGTLAGLAVQRAFFAGTAYGHPVNGTPASLARIGRADLVKLHAAAWRPERAVLVFAGAVTLDEAVALAQRQFGDWQGRGEAPKAARVDARALPAAAAPLVIDVPGAGQAGVAFAVPAVPAAAPERFAAEVTNAVLGQGYSSRLNQEIRIKRGLSYGASSRLDQRRDSGTLQVGVQTKNPSAPEVVQLIGAELDRLAGEPVPAPELGVRKAALIGGFGRTVETTAGLADETAALALAGLPMTDLTQRIPRLEAVSAEEVQAFAKAHFAPARRRLAVAGVAAEFAEALRRADPRWQQVPAASLQLADAPPKR